MDLIKLVVYSLAEIVFPGRPGSGGDAIRKVSRGLGDSATNSGLQPFPSDIVDIGVSNQREKLHPLGLTWSELESTYQNNNEQLLAFGGGAQDKLLNPMTRRGGPFGAAADSTHVPENWNDAYGRNALSGSNLHEDAMDARHSLRMEQEFSRFDMAERLLAQQLQQQQQHRQPHSLVPSHNSHLNDMMQLEQLANRTGQSVEHILALQLQQQRQLQLEQQQFHEQQMLLKEQQQQSQARQIVLEQLLQNQMRESGRGPSRIDAHALRSNNALEEAIMQQQFLNDLQQRAQFPSRHPEPSIEQLIHAKYGQMPHPGHQNDLLELLSRGRQNSLDPQILRQEQLHGRQLPLALRQRLEMEEERQINPGWLHDEASQFQRKLGGSHRAASAGLGPLDFYSQQLPPSEEHLSHFDRNLSLQDRNLSLQDRIQQGLYDPGMLPFERSMSFTGGGAGLNLDVMNSMAHGQGMEIQEQIGRMHPGGLGGFMSDAYSQRTDKPLTPNHFHGSHLDTTEGRWSETNGQLPNDWMELRNQQLHIHHERQKREPDTRSTEDPSLWMSAGTNDDSSKRLLMELLHHKSNHPSSEQFGSTGGVPRDRRPVSGHSRTSTANSSFSVMSDQEAAFSNSFAVGSFGSDSAGPLQNRLGEGISSLQDIGVDSGIDGSSQVNPNDFSMRNKAPEKLTLSNMDGDKRVVTNEGVDKISESRQNMVGQAVLTSMGGRETTANVHSRHASLDTAGNVRVILISYIY